MRNDEKLFIDITKTINRSFSRQINATTREEKKRELRRKRDSLIERLRKKLNIATLTNYKYGKWRGDTL